MDKDSKQCNDNGKVRKIDIVENSNDNNSKEISIIRNEEQSSNEIIDLNELHIVDKIEESILKQLINLNSYEEMPQSSLKRIKRFTLIINCLISFFIINLVIICLICFNNNLFYVLNDMFNDFKLNYNINLNNDLIMSIDFAILLVALFFLVYYFVSKILYSSKLKNIKTKVGDVEFNGFEDLPFNKKLFEILYIFKKNKIKAVFFEDIDRFPEDIVIMVIDELKELNTIINTSKVISQKVTFIYEFKDSIFKDYWKRNKFYDYIISVMPLSTPLNSIYLLDNLCKNNNCEIDLDLVKIISKYVTDYRTMINIVNDHLLFRKILDIPDCEENHLFATMVYKNIEIHEYDKLLSLNNHLDELIRGINLKIENKLKEINENLIDIEFLQNNGLLTSYSDDNYYDEEEYWEWTLTRLFDMDDDGNIISTDGVSKFNPEDFIKETKNKNFDFDKYKCNDLELKRITKKMWDKCGGPLVSTYIRDIKRKKELILNRPQMIDYSDIKIEKEENVSDLVFDLIVSGFLSDKYLEYISLPINNELFTKNDYKYVLRITHNYVVPDIKLDNVQSIINYIDPSIHHNLRNYSLFDDYSKKGAEVKKDYAIFFREVLKEFSELDDSKIDFINSYYKKTETTDKTGFYHLIAKLTKDVNFVDNLEYYYNSDKRDKNIIMDNIVYAIIDVVDLSKEINKTDFFNKYLNENKIIISKFDLSYDNILSNFKFLNIRISDVSLLDLESQKIAFENNLYSFSNDNSKIYNFSFDNKNKKFAEYALADIENFYEEYYKLNREVKINNNNVIKRIMEQNISKSIKKEIAIRENYKIVKKQSENIGLTWRSIIMKHNKGVNNNILVNYIISNREIFFSDTIKIYPLKDAKFNKELFTKLFEYDLLYESKQYYRELKESGFYKIDLEFDYKSNYSEGIISFMIDNFMMSVNKRNSELIINSKNVSLKNKGRYFYRVSIQNMRCIGFVKQDMEVLRELLKYGDLKAKIKVLRQLSLSNEDLISVYPLIFDENKYYEFTKSDFKKVIEPNIDLFEYKLDHQYYYVKKK